MTDEQKNKVDGLPDNINLEELLMEKEKLDQLIKQKFSKTITVMFTDLSGSTRLSEELGDITMRALLKNHNDVVFPLIEKNNGVLVKTMGDGTMSYFKEAPDAVRAAIEIQRGIDNYNEKKGGPALLIRCGLNTGQGIVEKEDLYGDVVNVAQRFEALGRPKEILLSIDTYARVKDIDEFVVIFQRESTLKGKSGIQKVYKAVWFPEEIAKYKSGELKPRQPAEQIEGSDTDEMPTDVNWEAPAQMVTMPAASDARLVVEQSGDTITYHDLTKDSIIIGRSSQVDIVLSESHVSRKHARVFREGDKCYIEDMKSSAGTYFGGKRITKKLLEHGDRFMIGSASLTFEKIAAAPKKKASLTDDFTPTMVFGTVKPLQLVVVAHGEVAQTKDFMERPLTFGRASVCDVQLVDPLVSRQHARISRKGDTITIEDLKSNNGTLVNSKPVDKADIMIDDEIGIGPFIIRIVDPTLPRPTPKETQGSISLTRKVLSFLSKK